MNIAIPNVCQQYMSPRNKPAQTDINADGSSTVHFTNDAHCTNSECSIHTWCPTIKMSTQGHQIWTPH